MNKETTILQAAKSNVFAFLASTVIVLVIRLVGPWTEDFASHVFGVLVALFLFHTLKDVVSRNN